jgi:recombinational DNA repair ATPase RecF
MSEKYYINDIEIEGFRGINNEGAPLKLSLKTNKVNSIFAPNGMGKSSVFDSLSFLIRGRIDRIDEMKNNSDNNDYYNNKFHSQKKATVKVTFTSDNEPQKVYTVEVIKEIDGDRKIISNHPSPLEFLESMNHENLFLDYQSFNSFVLESPLNRGREFSLLLGLSKLSDIRQSLDTLTRNAENDLNIKVINQSIIENNKSLDSTKNQLIDYSDRINVTFINDEIDFAYLQEQCLKKLKEIPFILSYVNNKKINEIDYDALVKETHIIEKSDKRDLLSIKMQELTKFKLSEMDSSMLNKELNDLLELVKQRETLYQETLGEKFKKLFSAASEIVNQDDWQQDKCPLCETSPVFNGKTISTHISEHIHGFENIDRITDELKKRIKEEYLFTAFLKIENESLINLAEENKIFSKIRASIDTAYLSVDGITALIKHVNDTLKNYYLKLAKIDEEIRTLRAELPESLVSVVEIIEIIRSIDYLINLYHNYKNELTRLKQEQEKRTEWKIFIDKAASDLAKAEGKLINSICSEIEKKASKFFEKIMVTTDIIPKLERSMEKEHLKLKLSKFFTETSVDAVPLLSESFRNAYAMSIYLAAALRTKSLSRFLILDDVTSSFDSGHQFSLMELLRTEISNSNNPDGLQLIILSHDGLLEKYFDRQSSSTPTWHRVNLKGAAPTGLVMVNEIHNDRLKGTALNYIINGNAELAIPLVRQYLEFKLVEIINKLEILVPLDFSIRDDKKMVSNSLGAIKKAISLYKKANSLVITEKQVNDINTVHVAGIIANWVSHYESAATANFTPAILKYVINSVDELVDCFMYDCVCSGTTIRKYYKNLSVKACRC